MKEIILGMIKAMIPLVVIAFSLWMFSFVWWMQEEGSSALNLMSIKVLLTTAVLILDTAYFYIRYKKNKKSS